MKIFLKFGKLIDINNVTKIIFTFENYLYNSKYLVLDTSSYICIKNHLKMARVYIIFHHPKKPFY